MKEIKLLKEMFALQQKLNDQTNGIGWEKGYTKNDRIINWKRCIYMECAELIDSFNWKHWKDINKKADWDNAKIEIIDIWHFIMSLALEDYKNNDRGSIDDLVLVVKDIQGFDDFKNEAYLTEETASAEIVNDIELIINMTTNFKVNIFDDLIKDYFSVALKCGVNLDVLYKFYIAKNVLNQFRQDHGYKEGTYKKVWAGKEDNEVMLEILDKETLGAEELYKELEKAYKK